MLTLHTILRSSTLAYLHRKPTSTTFTGLKTFLHKCADSSHLLASMRMAKHSSTRYRALVSFRYANACLIIEGFEPIRIQLGSLRRTPGRNVEVVGDVNGNPRARRRRCGNAGEPRIPHHQSGHPITRTILAKQAETWSLARARVKRKTW